MRVLWEKTNSNKIYAQEFIPGKSKRFLGRTIIERNTVYIAYLLFERFNIFMRWYLSNYLPKRKQLKKSENTRETLVGYFSPIFQTFNWIIIVHGMRPTWYLVTIWIISVQFTGCNIRIPRGRYEHEMYTWMKLLSRRIRQGLSHLDSCQWTNRPTCRMRRK